MWQACVLLLLHLAWRRRRRMCVAMWQAWADMATLDFDERRVVI
jgi:hypothetical protein